MPAWMSKRKIRSLTVNFQTLPDGKNYTAGKVLNVAAKQIVVKIDDSNYQKRAN